MTSWLNPSRWLLYGGLIAALVLGYFAWADHVGDVREAKVRAEYTAIELIATQTARATEQAWQAQLTKAQDEATKRQTKLAADAAALRTERNGLRDDLAAVRASVPGLTADSIAELAIVSGELLSECSDRYQGVSAEADALWADRQTLIEAWPKN
jgi:hypothetical protein